MNSVVVLTPEQLEQLVRKAVREELSTRSAEAPAEVLTREEAAALLSVHPHVLTRWVRARGVPGVKIGNEWRFRRSELLAWLDRQGGQP